MIITYSNIISSKIEILTVKNLKNQKKKWENQNK